ncbi:MAG: hypothetical protein J6K17_14740 [Oscillospiraceae bacterium]|nr:hypothetical protein [Oscillospiraceae bacterium]
MKSIFEEVINRGTFDLKGLLKKIDVFNVEGKLTDEDRDDLYIKAREAADVANSVDVIAKLTELEQRVLALENASNDTATGETTANEYVVGKWYYTGDKVTFEGTEYICIAPAGAVCTWSPREYPAFWGKASEEDVL